MTATPLDFYKGRDCLQKALAQIEKDTTLSRENRQLILEYDRIRFLHGAAVLTRRGYRNLWQVVDGFNAWVTAGYEVERGA